MVTLEVATATRHHHRHRHRLRVPFVFVGTSSTALLLSAIVIVATLTIATIGKMDVPPQKPSVDYPSIYSHAHHDYQSYQINKGTSKVAIMGGTGMQGGAAIDLLLESGASPSNIRTLTRNANSPAARRLSKEKGISVLEGSQDIGNEEDPEYGQKVENLREAYARLLDGVECLFALTFTQFDNSTREKRLGRILFESIAASPSIKLVVFSGGERTGIPLLDAKADIEDVGRQVLRSSDTGLRCVFLHSSFFMENTLIKGNHKRYRLSSDGRRYELSLPLPFDRRIAMISAKDIGNIAAQILLNEPFVEEARFRSLTIVGDIVSPRTLLQSIKMSVKEFEFQYRQTNYDDLKATMGEAQTTLVRQMYETYYAQNSDENLTRQHIEQTRKIYPKTADIDAWVKKDGKIILSS